jgi:prepilin-type N-terminal cleavage/methylation domain-containing protein
MQRIRQQHGVSLVELLVAMAILATALMPILGIFVQALKTTESSTKRTIAMNLAREMLDEILSKQFVDPQVDLTGSSYYPKGSTAQPFGFNGTGENDGTYSQSVSRMLQFDDVDDYNGWCRGPACNCTGVTPAGICSTTLPQESYNGVRFVGAEYPHYQDFTLQVGVYNLKPTVRSNHSMQMGVGAFRETRNFQFFDFRTERMGTPATAGTTNMKVIKVTVLYGYPLTPNIRKVAPPFTIEDVGLSVLPVGREML